MDSLNSFWHESPTFTHHRKTTGIIGWYNNEPYNSEKISNLNINTAYEKAATYQAAVGQSVFIMNFQFQKLHWPFWHRNKNLMTANDVNNGIKHSRNQLCTVNDLFLSKFKWTESLINLWIKLHKCFGKIACNVFWSLQKNKKQKNIKNRIIFF